MYGNRLIVFIAIPPPQGLSRGKVHLSIRSTLIPFSAINFAAVEPAGPAPTITTS